MKKKKPTSLTVDKLRQYKGLENTSDAEAENIVHTLRKFTELTHLRYQEEKQKMKEFKSTHNLEFESIDYEFNLDPTDPWKRFRIGTCKGLWRAINDSYEILAIVNDEKGNGHLIDVFEWFEQSCKRDGFSLKVLELFNNEFKDYLIKERGFKKYLKDDLIKHFNEKH